MFEKEAEEIANKRCHEIMCYGHCSFSSPKHHRCGEWHREYNCALEGLKAGRPQWHDLQKDPNDLPKDNNEVLVYMWDSYYIGYFNLDSWHFENFSEGKEQADAWCELPRFEQTSP